MRPISFDHTCDDLIYVWLRVCVLSGVCLNVDIERHSYNCVDKRITHIRSPGLIERLTRELREMRPFESTFSLGRAAEPSRDAWLGARQVAAEHSDIYISREDYAEKGGDYLHEHRWSNAFFATPAPIVVDPSSVDVIVQ